MIFNQERAIYKITNIYIGTSFCCATLHLVAPCCNILHAIHTQFTYYSYISCQQYIYVIFPFKPRLVTYNKFPYFEDADWSTHHVAPGCKTLRRFIKFPFCSPLTTCIYPQSTSPISQFKTFHIFPNHEDQRIS